MAAASRLFPIGGQATVRLPWPVDLPPIGLVFASIVCIAVAALLYLTQVSRVATSGYELANLEHRREQLKREHQQLLVELARLQSISQVDQTAASELGMVQAHTETFLTAATLSAALDIEAAIQAEERDTGENPSTWRQRLGAFFALVQSKLDRTAKAAQSDGDYGADSDRLSAGPARTQS